MNIPHPNANEAVASSFVIMHARRRMDEHAMKILNKLLQSCIAAAGGAAAKIGKPMPMNRYPSAAPAAKIGNVGTKQ